MRTVLCFGIWAFLLFTATSAHAAVRISEINWKGVSGNQYGEWFELENTGSTPVDLSGYTVYKAGGATKLIALSKTIPANGFLLVERTTASSPDPVPGIADEAGSFGGGGLSNAGEHLVLLDASGAFVSEIDFSGGWPAGDSYTETMQYVGASWVSAPATPGVANSSAYDAGSEDAATDGGDEEGAGAKKDNAPLTTSLRIETRGELFSGYPLSFDAAVSRSDGARIMSGVVRWNMGDGTAYVVPAGDTVSHAYLYPGTYAVTAAYRRLAALPDAVDAQARTTVHVIDATLAASSGSFGSVDVKNSGSREVDVSSWQLRADGRLFVFPSGSTILPRATVRFPVSVTGFAPETPKELLLLLPNEAMISSVFASAPRQAVHPAAGKTISETAVLPVREVLPVQTVLVADASAAPVPETNLSTKTGQSGTAAIMGAVALALVGAALAFLIVRGRSDEEASIADSIEILE